MYFQFSRFSANSYTVGKFLLNFLNTFYVSPNDLSKFFYADLTQDKYVRK